MPDDLFKPNEKQINLLRVMLDPEVQPTITAHCAAADVSRETYYTWFENEAFVKWFKEAWEFEMAKQVPWLDKIGMIKAPKDYRYWEAMQMKYAKFKKKMEIESPTENKSLDRIASVLEKMYDEEAENNPEADQ